MQCLTQDQLPCTVNINMHTSRYILEHYKACYTLRIRKGYSRLAVTTYISCINEHVPRHQHSNSMD